MRRKLSSLRSDRRFQIWEFLVSHGQLLIRSPMQGEPGNEHSQPTNVDLAFTAVEYISIPRHLKGLEILEPTEGEIASVEHAIGKRLPGRARVYVLSSSGQRYLVAGILHSISENDWDLYDSPFEFHHRHRAEGGSPA